MKKVFLAVNGSFISGLEFNRNALAVNAEFVNDGTTCVNTVSGQ